MAEESPLPYRDESLPVEQRVADLLDRMTVSEKVAQLVSMPPRRILSEDESTDASAESNLLGDDDTVNPDAVSNVLADGIGHVTRIGGEANLEPERAAAVADQLQTFLREKTRLGIPAIPHEECLSGYMGPRGTTYPQAIGLASTWDPSLIEGMTDRIRRQLLAIGARHALSPVLDVGRDPRWGRIEETFGEDPYLIARMARAYVEGLGGDSPTERVSATLKHFAGHGVGEAGKNHAPAAIGERELRDVHLFPFEAVIRTTDVDSVMPAYHDIDGVPCSKDRSLLTDVLRGEWGFDGTVVSDYFGVRFLRDEHRVATGYRDAAVQALEAGLDVELPQADCYTELERALDAGDLSEETVDTAVGRVLTQKIRLGLLDESTPDVHVKEAFGSEAGRTYARRLASESIVLLKNEDDLLPIEGVDSLAVVGPKADTPAGQVGDYAYAAHYPDAETNREMTTPVAALRDRLGEENVSYTPGCTTTGSETDGFEAAVSNAISSDLAVAFVGARSATALAEVDADRERQPDVPTSGEGADVTDLGLPGVQRQLIERLVRTDTPLVVVIVSGKPHSIEWIDREVPAILHAWLPGEEGGPAIADVLFGDHNPSGRLPVSVPKSAGQIPVHYARKPNSRDSRHVYVDSDPLYPFGFGQSYTDFAYGELELTTDTVAPMGTIDATVTVENVGDRAGSEVVQLYTHQRTASLTRPHRRLRGFEKVRLEPGASKTITFSLSTTQLAFHDADVDPVVEPGEYEILIGSSATTIEARTPFTVRGERRFIPTTARRYFTGTTVED